MKKLFLFDAYAIIFRSYYAFIKRPTINSKGLNTSAILGFCNTLKEIMEKEHRLSWCSLRPWQNLPPRNFPSLQGTTTRNTRGHQTLRTLYTAYPESHEHPGTDRRWIRGRRRHWYVSHKGWKGRHRNLHAYT